MLINVKPDGSVSEKTVNEILLALAPHAGKVAQLDIKRYHPPRSSQQLRGLMGTWMKTILEELGYGKHDLDFVYNEIKIACGYFELKAIPGTAEAKKMPLKTRGFTKDEYSKFMTDFKRYVEDSDTGLGIRLPELNPENARI